MRYDFDETIPRRGTNSVKWDSAADDGVLFRPSPRLCAAEWNTGYSDTPKYLTPTIKASLTGSAAGMDGGSIKTGLSTLPV